MCFKCFLLSLKWFCKYFLLSIQVFRVSGSLYPTLILYKSVIKDLLALSRVFVLSMNSSNAELIRLLGFRFVIVFQYAGAK